MADNEDISRMLRKLYSTFLAEVETHNAKNWENPDTIRLYECLQAAICKTQHAFCQKGDPDYLHDPAIDPTTLLKD